jgi:hypothetical protein
MDADSITDRITDIQHLLRDLPEVNTAAKLRALVGRVEVAVKQRLDLTKAATQLEQAANAALNDDPWVRLHRAAVELVAALNG